MTDEEYQALSRRANEYLDLQLKTAQTKFNLGTYERYDWNQETGQLVFSDQGVPKVIADIQFVGSVSLKSHTWLWSWANPTVLKSMAEDMNDVRSYGAMHSIRRLTEAKWPAEEVDGWEMTAIAAYILRSKGAYRSPDGDGYTFMVFSDIRFADQPR